MPLVALPVAALVGGAIAGGGAVTAAALQARSQGKATKAAQQQMSIENRLRQEELDRQRKQQQLVESAVGRYLTQSGEGFSPQQLAMLRSAFMDRVSGDFHTAGENVRQALASRGMGSGAGPEGGTYGRGLSELQGATAATTATGLRDISLADYEQNLQNRFNAAGLVQGNAGQTQRNVGAFTGSAGYALQNYMQSQMQPSPWRGLLTGLSQFGGDMLTGALQNRRVSNTQLSNLPLRSGANTTIAPPISMGLPPRGTR